MSTADFITFGCRLNSYETAVMRRNAAAAGVRDTIVVNTCAVTAEAERQARQAIRKARRAHPGARVVVTGCAAQITPDRYAAMPEVDQVLGNDEKLDPAIWAREEPVLVNDIMSVRETAGHLIDGLDGRTRAFVQIQNGCDHRCTFCIIPFGRGNSRSVAVGDIVNQVRALVAAGYREVVLTGVDLTSYGGDLPGMPRLGQLVRRLLRLVPELDRLRLSSLDPAEFDDDLWRAIGEEQRLMPHLHLSLQAGDDMVLKRMKRRHSRADAVAVCARARALRPDVAFGADLIAGFPTETDAMFANSLAIIDDCDLTWLHVFPYSPRQGTPAARMPQVQADIRKARAAALRAAGNGAVSRHLAGQVGTTRAILVENDGLGRTPQFAPVAVQGAPTGALLPVRITGHDGERLTGTSLAAAA